jgi:hypothetical protein
MLKKIDFFLLFFSFRFPKDEPRRTFWEDFVRKHDPHFTQKAKTKLCSNHFTKQHILGGSRKYLSPEAIPTFIPQNNGYEVLFDGNINLWA